MANTAVLVNKFQGVFRALHPRALVTGTWGKYRAWSKGAGKFGLIVNILVGLILAGIAWTVFGWSSLQAKIRDLPTIEDAFTQMDAGEVELARRTAVWVGSNGRSSKAEDGQVALILAEATYAQAQSLLGDARTDSLRMACKYYEQAAVVGIPQDRQLPTFEHWGESLLVIGEYKSCRIALEQALVSGTPNRPRILKDLAKAYASGDSPDYAKAVAHLNELLATPNLDAADQSDALLAKAHVQYAAGDPNAAVQTLAQIPNNSYLISNAALLLGQIQMAQAGELASRGDSAGQQQQLRQAIESFRKAQANNNPLDLAAPAAGLLIGRAYNLLDDPSAAAVAFASVRTNFLDLPEGMAASVEECEIRLRQNNVEQLDAVFRQLMAGLTPTQLSLWNNPWMSLEEFRARNVAIVEAVNDREQHLRAASLAALLQPFLEPAVAHALSAEIQSDWGQKLLVPTSARVRISDARQAEAEDHFRQAAQAYLNLAEARFTTASYPSDLWRAATYFIRGNDYAAALQAFTRYDETNDLTHNPESLLGQAECHFALGELPQAQTRLENCIGLYPQSPFVPRAKFWLARVHASLGQSSAAEDKLLNLIDESSLTPESQEWRDAIYELGQLYSLTGATAKSVERFQEFAARYPTDRRSPLARYLMAQGLTELARQTERDLEENATESARVTREQTRQSQLRLALAEYDRILQELVELQREHGLSPQEDLLYRNSLFGRGGVYFEIRMFDEAIRAYSMATNRYQHAPEVLQAYVQIAICYRQLGDELKAVGTLSQARVVLDQFPPSADFRAATDRTREEWILYLDWLSKVQ